MKNHVVMCAAAFVAASACASGGGGGGDGGAQATGFSQAVADVVATCSAGATITNSAQASLSVELTKIMTGEGAANAQGKIESAIKGIAFADKDLTNPNVLEAQRIYSKCVTDNLATLKQ